MKVDKNVHKLLAKLWVKPSKVSRLYGPGLLRHKEQLHQLYGPNPEEANEIFRPEHSILKPYKGN